MDLRGTLRLIRIGEREDGEPNEMFLTGGDSIFTAKIYQTGLPQSPEEEFVGTLLIFADGETKLVPHEERD